MAQPRVRYPWSSDDTERALFIYEERAPIRVVDNHRW